MLELAVLGSGSRGNSTLVRTARTDLLIDAGLSARQIGLRLRASGADPAAVDAVLLTHEHTDHLRGLPVLQRRFPVPVLGNEATLAAAGPALADAPEAWAFATGEAFTCGDFAVTSFAVSHDAAEPVGYVLEAEGTRVAYVTDLGCLTPQIVSLVRGCHVVILEANHDVDMLWSGPYPWPTKERIAGALGHLDNATGAAHVAAIAGSDTKHLVLAHLSQNNNEPGLARRLYARALREASRGDVRLAVAAQATPSALLRL